MEAFSLIEFAYRNDECGFFMVIKYLINNKWITDVKQFKQLGAADLYIKASKKTWLLFFIENWLLIVQPDIHKTNENQNVWFSYEDFCNCDLINVCDRVIKGQEILKQLLPNVTDSNYESCVEIYNQIISFCKNEIETVNF